MITNNNSGHAASPKPAQVRPSKPQPQLAPCRSSGLASTGQNVGKHMAGRPVTPLDPAWKSNPLVSHTYLDRNFEPTHYRRDSGFRVQVLGVNNDEDFVLYRFPSANFDTDGLFITLTRRIDLFNADYTPRTFS